MAIEHYLTIDTTASPEEVKAAILREVRFDEAPDWKDTRNATSTATSLTLFDPRKVGLEPGDAVALDDKARITVCFRSRDYGHLSQFGTETISSVVTLLKAYPDGDAVLKAYVDRPALQRRHGKLVLASSLAEDDLWAASQPYIRLVDLPYIIAPLEP